MLDSKGSDFSLNSIDAKDKVKGIYYSHNQYKTEGGLEFRLRCGCCNDVSRHFHSTHHSARGPTDHALDVAVGFRPTEKYSGTVISQFVLGSGAGGSDGYLNSLLLFVVYAPKRYQLLGQHGY